MEELVSAEHSYRYFKQILNEWFIQRCLSGVSSDLGREGYGITRLFHGLLLQFMEDLSDRAIRAKLVKLNNEVLPKDACDKHAKIGCKGKNKYWVGYKRHSAVYADKRYCIQPAPHTAVERGVYLAAIMMNHMLAKNHDKDRWFSHLRMPYDSVFLRNHGFVTGVSLKINLPRLCL